MVKLFRDLELFNCNFDKYLKNTMGVMGFACIVDNKEGDNAHDGFYILVRTNINDELLVETICHELEHYDITKILKCYRIPEQKPIYKNGELVVMRKLYPEWAHANPSYFPEATLRKETEKQKASSITKYIVLHGTFVHKLVSYRRFIRKGYFCSWAI